MKRLRLLKGYTAVWLSFLCACTTASATPDTRGNVDSLDTTSLASDFCRDSIVALGLPVIVIETVGGEEPTCDFIDHPEGCMGKAITNATKVPGALSVYETGGSQPLFTTGNYLKDKSGMTIKIRGNTSAYPPKKPYKIKLEKKEDLLCPGTGNTGKDKEWLLIKDTRLFTVVGNTMAQLLGTQWTPRYRFVNVMLNGDYRGVYVLTESVKRAKDCRINVATDGWIVELDPYWWNQEGEYVESVRSPQMNFTFKYPDWEDTLPDQTAYIQEVMRRYELSVAEGTYPQFIDVESVATWVLAHDILGTLDGAGANIFFTKYDSSDDTKLEMGPLWDFDSIEQTEGRWSGTHSFAFTPFFKSPEKAFVRAFVDKWEEVKDSVAHEVLAALKDFAHSDEGKALDRSLTYDAARWNSTLTDVAASVKKSEDWFGQRMDWLDEAICRIDTAQTAISEVERQESEFDVHVRGRQLVVNLARPGGTFVVYDMAGRLVYQGPARCVTLPCKGGYLVRWEGVSRRVFVVE